MVVRPSSAALAVLVVLALLLPGLGRAQDSQPNHAALVVRHGDGRVLTACVAFAEASISGIELLRRSGLDLVTQGGGGGAAVCKLDGEGCDYPTEDCFCRRDGPLTVYWAYHRLRDGRWSFSPLGASNTRVQPGDVEGWAWGTGSVNSGAQPPLLTFEQVCQAAAPPEPTVAPPTAPPEPTTVPPTTPPEPTVAPPTAPPEPTAVPPTAPPAATTRPATPARAASTATAAPTVAPSLVPATAPPNPTPQPTLEPSPAPATAAATARPTDAPAAVVPTAAPPATAEPAGGVLAKPAAPSTGNRSGSYLAFGALTLLLLGGIVAALRRSRH